MDGLSAFAAGLQIADTCARLSFAIAKLVHKLRVAPADIQRKASQLRQLIALTDSLQSDFHASAPEPCPIRDALSPEALAQLQELLDCCHEETLDLNRILGRLIPQGDDTFLRKQIKSTRAIVNEEKIQRHLEHLHHLSTRLILWYNHQLLRASSKYL